METNPKSTVIKDARPEIRANYNTQEKAVKILKAMFDELEHADTKYHDDKMSREEIKASYQTIRCELQELKREISRKKKRPDLMRKEAIQVLAMAFKFNRDVIFCNLGDN